ncbi:MAG: hypothetical protein NVSMB6_26370 [Burkholderiaceae bacterium]
MHDGLTVEMDRPLSLQSMGRQHAPPCVHDHGCDAIDDFQGYGVSRMKVTLYMRPGCHLCTEARQMLIRLGYEVAEVNIDEDGDLRRRYTERVPVLAVDGKELLSGRIREAEARRLLASHRSREN